MKKMLILLAFLVVLLAGCNLSAKGQPSDQELVATAVAQTMIAEQVQAAITLTSPFSKPEDGQQEAATATPEQPTATPEPSATPEPTMTPTQEPTATITVTSTPEDEDPLSWLGSPSWTGDFAGGDDEGFYTGDDDQTTIEAVNDALTMTHHLTTVGWHTWSMNYREITNFYYEADINVKACSGVDEYGLVFRGPDYSSGYFFALRCNGEYSLRGYDGEYTTILYWQYSDAINAGANQSNRVGVWAEGNTIRLYINGKLIKQVTDDTFGGGHFGFLIAGYETAGFSVQVDRARYWTF
ncbi:MAG: hypothetical protein V2J07_08965 [Anaerolineae bacterium]|jgi:hypothetical protein|nr:hypothetical protein [Anaerolineae bacterium]